MNTVLFDTPGPNTRRRLVILNWIGTVVFVAIAVFVVLSLHEAGQFTPAYWMPFTDPGIMMALLRGLVATLRAAFYAIILALGVGAILAVGRLSRTLWISVPSVVVIEFFRSVPPLLLVLFLFLAFTFSFGNFGAFLMGYMPGSMANFLGIDQMDRLGPLVVALALYQGSILAEIFRSGLLALPRGQAEAGYSIGLTRGAVLRLILAPQALRIMLPATISEIIVLLKQTAFGYIISYQELLRTGRLITANYHNIIPAALVMLVIYLCLNLAIAHLARWIQQRQERKYGMQAMASIQVAHAG